MAYTPTSLPAAAAVSVGTSATAITVPAGALLKLGALFLHRVGSGAVYWGFDSGVTTSTGVGIAKGSPGSVAPSVVQKEAFYGLRTVYLISDTASQTVDTVLI